MKNKCAIVVSNGVKLQKNITPDIKHLLSPILDSANLIQTTMANNSLHQIHHQVMGSEIPWYM